MCVDNLKYMKMTESTEEEIRRQIFDELNCFKIDAREISNGTTYIDSTEAKTLTENIIDIIRKIGI